MFKIVLNGCCGKMGAAVTKAVSDRDDVQIVAGVDIFESDSLPYPVFSTFSEVPCEADVIIDFSNRQLIYILLLLLLFCQ